MRATSRARCPRDGAPNGHARIVEDYEVLMIGVLVLMSQLAAAQTASPQRHVDLPTGRARSIPVPGFVARTNSFPSRIAISPDGRFAAVLNQGYGTEQSGLMQSIGVL